MVPDALPATALNPAPTGNSRPVRWFWGLLTTAGLAGIADTVLLALLHPVTSAALLPGVTGGGLLLLSLFKRCFRRGKPLLPGRLNPCFWLAVVFAALGFWGVEAALIASASRTTPASDAECMVVLGAGLWGMEPSPTLERRLQAAAEYLLAHPQLPVIVSGGQGPGEDRTEAAAMREYLLARGVAPERIRCEDASTNTWENFLFTRRLLNQSPAPAHRTGAEEKNHPLPRLLIVTSGFHMLRSQMLARQAGFEVSGLSAPTPTSIAVNLYGREFVALMKSLLMDRSVCVTANP